MARRKKETVASEGVGAANAAPHQALIDALSQDEEIKKSTEKSGEKLVSVGTDKIDSDVVDFISTQIPMLDFIIGRPGIPVGRVTTIYGQEGTGKTTIGLQILAETQRRGGLAVLVDAERRHWRERSEALGIDHSKLIQLRGTTLEENFSLIKKLVRMLNEKAPGLQVTILYDSIAGSTPVADIEDSNIPARYAKPVRRFLREITPELKKTNVALVLVNHVIANLQFTFLPGQSGNTMPAAHPIGFFSSLLISLSRSAYDGPPEEPTGVVVSARIEDSRIAMPRRKGKFRLDFKHGVNYADSALDLAIQLGLVTGNGGWYHYEGREKPFRRDDFTVVLEEEEQLADMIKAAPLLWTTGDAN